MTRKIKKLTVLSRNLRNYPTDTERFLWYHLKNKFPGIHFRRQFPIGNYIVDFACRSKKIVIEIDGGQHNEENNIEYDKTRTEYLNSKGYKVIRFWNNEIDQNHTSS